MWLSYGNRNEFKDQQFLEIEKNMLDSIKLSFFWFGSLWAASMDFYES